MSSVRNEPEHADSLLRVSVVCFRLNADVLETLVCTEGALPSAQPAMSESLDETAERIIHQIFDRPAAYVEQLYTFSTNQDGNREITVSYLALLSPDYCGCMTWLPVSKHSASVDAEVIEYALVRLRAKLEYTSIAFHLMPPTFTLADLQTAYETMLNASLDKRNFRRRMTTGGMLVDTGDKRREGPHRPASLYRFSGRADRSSYLTPQTAGDVS